jgi:23S rRNA pseudouridine2605 synthase
MRPIVVLASCTRPNLYPYPAVTAAKRHGLARVLSKLGVCSRTQAEALIRAGRVSVEGRIQSDPERPTNAAEEKISLDGVEVREASRVYLALNKPRGLMVTAADERGRDTIYPLLESAGASWLAPVGRLDRASEGLLFVTNDSAWAARITDPAHNIEKTYHVQITGLPDDAVLSRMLAGIEHDRERLAVVKAHVLRSGEKNAWLEIVLNEGRNRHIRRLMATLGYDVLRLIRISIGTVELGSLPKGQWRELTTAERDALDR